MTKGIDDFFKDIGTFGLGLEWVWPFTEELK